MKKKDDNEIIMYQPDSTLCLDVRVDNDTVWLNRNQIAVLFDRDVKTIGKHINNALKEELAEIPTVAKFATVQHEGKRVVTRYIEYYNLDVVISVGYRVKSNRGIQFRIWANKILKEYMIRGYSINHRLMLMEERVDRKFLEHDKQLLELNEKVDFIIKSSIRPKEGVFFDGQIFDAYVLVADLFRQADKRIVIIDNYIDDSVLVQLSKRKPGITVDIYDGRISRQLRQDVEKHNEQFPGVSLHKCGNVHDRFVIIDNEIYHIGASLKDLGKKLFAFSKLESITPSEIITKLH